MNCLVCVDPVPSGDYHTVCLRHLFGSDVPPTIDVMASAMQTVALATVGRATMPGVQPKISVGLIRDRRLTLRVNSPEGRQYILKPQTGIDGLGSMPENEHLSMLIARRFGILTPQFGLVRLVDGSLAYLIERFDRLPDGRKARQEDFAQLLGLRPSDKYRATGEECVEVIRRYSARARADLVRLFERFVLAFWIGDGDMHLKNLSLLAGPDGRHSLSPAYDVTSGALYKSTIPRASELALPLSGAAAGLVPGAWMDFAATCEVPEQAARVILRRPSELFSTAEGMLDRSLLNSRAHRSDYHDALRARSESLLVAAA